MKGEAGEACEGEYLAGYALSEGSPDARGNWKFGHIRAGGPKSAGGPESRFIASWDNRRRYPIPMHRTANQLNRKTTHFRNRSKAIDRLSDLCEEAWVYVQLSKPI